MNFGQLVKRLSKKQKNGSLDMSISTEVKINPFNLSPFVLGAGLAELYLVVVMLGAAIVRQRWVKVVQNWSRNQKIKREDTILDNS